MTVQEFQARKTERIAIALAHFVDSTPADKLDWCPATGDESCTRSVLGVVAECVACNRMIASLLCCDVRTEEPMPKVTDAASARAELKKSATEAAAAIRDLPDEALGRTYQMTSMTMSGEVLMDIPYRNMVYHGGQINYIQLLLGDKEFHVTPAAFK